MFSLVFLSSILFLFWAVEFPAVLLNTSTGEMESEFHMFVQPSEQARLSEFCTELTGITQVQWPTFLVSLWSCCTFSQELRTIVMLELASTSKWDYYPLFNLAPLLQYRPRTLQHLNVCKLRTIIMVDFHAKNSCVIFSYNLLHAAAFLPTNFRVFLWWLILLVIHNNLNTLKLCVQCISLQQQMAGAHVKLKYRNPPGISK